MLLNSSIMAYGMVDPYGDSIDEAVEDEESIEKAKKMVENSRAWQEHVKSHPGAELHFMGKQKSDNGQHVDSKLWEETPQKKTAQQEPHDAKKYEGESGMNFGCQCGMEMHMKGGDVKQYLSGDDITGGKDKKGYAGIRPSSDKGYARGEGSNPSGYSSGDGSRKSGYRR